MSPEQEKLAEIRTLKSAPLELEWEEQTCLDAMACIERGESEMSVEVEENGEIKIVKLDPHNVLETAARNIELLVEREEASPGPVKEVKLTEKHPALLQERIA